LGRRGPETRTEAYPVNYRKRLRVMLQPGAPPPLARVIFVISMAPAGRCDLDRWTDCSPPCRIREVLQVVTRNSLSFSAEFGQQILQRVVDGQRPEDVARQLGRTPETIRHCLSEIGQKAAPPSQRLSLLQ